MINKSGRNAAVSPVIGTILLVAIAVVLTAIILTVVMGFSGDPNEKKVGLNAKPANTDGDDAFLILYGGESLSELVKLEMIDHNSPIGRYVEVWNIANGSVNVGLPYTAKDVAKPTESMAVYDTRINVRGTFNDGQEIILLVQPMTFFNIDVREEMKLSAYIDKVLWGPGRIDITDNYGRHSSVPTSTTTAVTSWVPGLAAYGGSMPGPTEVEIIPVQDAPNFGVSIRIDSVNENLDPAYVATLPARSLLSRSFSGAVTSPSRVFSQSEALTTGVPYETGPWKMTITVNGITEEWYLGA